MNIFKYRICFFKRNPKQYVKLKMNHKISSNNKKKNVYIKNHKSNNIHKPFFMLKKKYSNKHKNPLIQNCSFFSSLLAVGNKFKRISHVQQYQKSIHAAALYFFIYFLKYFFFLTDATFIKYNF